MKKVNAEVKSVLRVVYISDSMKTHQYNIQRGGDLFLERLRYFIRKYEDLKMKKDTLGIMRSPLKRSI